MVNLESVDESRVRVQSQKYDVTKSELPLKDYSQVTESEGDTDTIPRHEKYDEEDEEDDWRVLKNWWESKHKKIRKFKGRRVREIE